MTAPDSPSWMQGRHDEEAPICVGQWCCGCAAHPLGKPWGYNSAAWNEHDAAHHAPPLSAPVPSPVTRENQP